MQTDWQGKWGFDTHFFVYLLDADSPFFAPTVDLFRILIKNKVKFTMTQQNILETTKVLAGYRKLNLKKITTNLNNLIENFEFVVYSPLPTTLPLFYKLLKNSKRQQIFDTYLAATFLDNGIKNFFTLNTKDFKGLSELNIVNPFKK